MPAIQIKPGIYWIGVNDRTTDLFEGVWPITQEGVSYNSYLVVGEKIALIDLAAAHHAASFIEQVRAMVDPSKIDYVVLNHMEPDHTGAATLVRQLAPSATFLVSAKAEPMLAAYFGITGGVRVVSDGETLDLGGVTLQFHMIPFVHWPETMATWVPEHNVLFSCDAFGGYGALPGRVFDDQCQDILWYEREALRYYSNIVARFSTQVLRAIDKLKPLTIEVVAPSHGLVWRRDPGRIIALYAAWARLASEPAEPGVTLLYGSMYGNTERMMNAVAEGVAKAQVPLEIFDVARTHSSYFLPSLWTRSGVLVGAPTYEVSLFPPMAQAMTNVVHKRIANRQAAYFGSYGWSKGALKELQSILEPLKWTWHETLEFNGAPTGDTLRQGERFGEAFARSLLAGGDKS
ncbi:MAG: FprA family A-type flavoprotein [Anaerolineae bacterium]|jgi:anaerobic nitric oxide reductase flavorubredoxin|nr:FprA family A-type flavoprotein [Chloroflexota bacterium]